MEKTNLRAQTDRLWVQVETLQWALAQNAYVKADMWTGGKFREVFRFVCFIALGKKRYYDAKPIASFYFWPRIFEHR